MNHIKVKDVKKAWFKKSSFGKSLLYLEFFASFEENLFLNENNKLVLKEIGYDYIVVNKDLIVKASKEILKYLRNAIETENTNVKVIDLINNSYKEKIKNAFEEQCYADHFIDVDYEEISNKEECYIKEIPESIFNEELTYAEFNNKIREVVDSTFSIPESYICKNVKVNLSKQQLIIKKCFMRKLSELVSKNTNKKIIYRGIGINSIFENDNTVCYNSEIVNILSFINEYEDFNTLVDYVSTNKNPIMKGLYVKSEVFNNKLFYVKIENLKDFFIHRNLKNYDKEGYKKIVKYLDNCVMSEMVGNF